VELAVVRDVTGELASSVHGFRASSMRIYNQADERNIISRQV
jgi:hypothetical protein